MSGGVNIVSALDQFWIIQFQTCHSMYNDGVWIGAWGCLPWVFGLFFCLHRRTSRNVLGDGTNEEGESVAPLTMKLDEVEDIVLWLGSHLQQEQTRKNNKDDDEAEDKGWSLVVVEMQLEPPTKCRSLFLTWSNLHLKISEVSTGILPTLCEAEETVWPFLSWMAPNKWMWSCLKSCMMPMIFVASGFKPSIAV